MSHIRVTIIEAQNLKKMDFFTQSDGFVEIYLNKKCKKYRTKVIHNSKNPHWDESVVL
jgi:Ca2+-dependent lipid-binding protein